MLSRNQIKAITGLHHKKMRREEGLFLAEGEKVVGELLASGWNVRGIYATEDYLENFRSRSGAFGSAEIHTVSPTELERISTLHTPNRVLAVAAIPDTKHDFGVLSASLKMVLDGIQDPGNMGTLLRIAHWFGIRDILCSESTVECFNPKVVQGSMGSLFHVAVHYMDLNQFFTRNREEWKLPVYGSVLNGRPVYAATLEDKGFLVMGNESEGISPQLMKFITDGLSIPPFTDGGSHPDSLNVAVAAGIFCSEFRRRAVS